MKKAGTQSRRLNALRRRTEALLHKKPQALSEIPPEDIHQLIHELQVQQIELEMQNDELRQAQLQLAEARDKYIDLYDFAPLCYFTLDSMGRVAEANLSGADLLGVARSDLVTMAFTRFIAPEFQDSFYCHRRRVAETAVKQACKLKLLKKDGTEFYGLVDSIGVPDAEGAFSGHRMTLTDISSQHQTELELRESEEFSRSLLANVPNPTLVVGPDTSVKYVNPAFEKLTGYLSSEILGAKTPYPWWIEELQSQTAEDFNQGFETGVVALEGNFQKKNGEQFWVEIYSKPVIKDGELLYCLLSWVDTTERIRIQKALQESVRHFKSIFNDAPIGFFRTTPDGRILDANPALIQMLGYSSFEELAAVNLETDVYHPQYPRHQFRERIERDGVIKGKESLWEKSDNTLIYIRENANAVRDENGAVVCYEGTIEDITDQKQAQEHIQTLTQQLMQAQEDERRMLSRELHDTVAQELTVAKMACDLIYNELLNGRPPEAQRIQTICDALQKTISDIRNMSYNLRPPELEELGLAETIYRFCEEFTQLWDVAVDFQAAGFKNLELGLETQINLYRLVQEGLTNIRKHAAAGRVTLRLAAAFPNIILRIEDNGRGFDVQKRAAMLGQEKRMGLRSMQERVNLLNGQMKLRSKPGLGTKVTIKLPIEEKKRDV